MTDDDILASARRWGLFAAGIPQIKGFAQDIAHQAFEEAAKVCDVKQDWYVVDRCMGQATAVGACADEIRALKG